jgi:VWFA-related protein
MGFMTRSRQIATAVLVSLALAAGLLAQGPGQPPAQPTFRSTVDLVTTDAIVRGKNGAFIAELTKDDFEVWEDGVKQSIVSFVLVHGGRAFNLQAPPPPPAQEGIILPPPRPAADTAGRIIIVFIDDLHLDFQNTARIRDLFQRLSKDLIHDGDMYGVVSTGSSSIAQDLTYDRSRLPQILKKVAGHGLKPVDIIQGPQGAEGPSEVRYRAHVAFSTAYDLVRNLEQVTNRRKALVYISDGYDFNPFVDARLGTNPFFDGGRFRSARDYDQAYTERLKSQQAFADVDLVREMSELTRAANRANATIYTMDTRGLVAGGGDIEDTIDPQEYQNYLRKSQDSLRVIAEETGGFALVNSNDFDKAIKRIDAETSDYYVLGYYSTNPDPTQRQRRIEVKVTRPDTEVWSRKAYTIKEPRRPDQGGR